MSGIQREDDLERREADRAGAEAGAIGSSVSSDPVSAEGASDEAERPLAAAGGEADREFSTEHEDDR